MKQQTVRPRISSPFIGLTGGIPCGTTSNTEKPTGSFFPCGGGFPKAVPMCAFGAAQPQAAAAMPMAAAGFGAPGGAAVGSAACDLFDGLGTAKAESFQSAKC